MAGTPRSVTTRAAMQRPGVGGDYQSILHIDPELLDPEFQYEWITETVFGSDVRENVRTQMSTRGFTPVTVEEMPKAAPPLLPGEERNPNSLIRRGAAVLMKRPRVWGDEETQDLAALDAEAIRSVRKDVDGALKDAKKDGFEDLPGSGVKARVARGFRA